MSSLHEKVAERRAAESNEPRCVSLQPGGLGLIVCQWRGESWVLPWSQFISARLCGADADARLEVAFANHLVTLKGTNLAGLLEHLAAARIGCVRDLPPQYHPRSGESVSFITHIAVRSLAPSGEKEMRVSS